MRKTKSVASNLSFLTQKTAIKHRLIDVFQTLVDRFHEAFVCIKFFRIFSNMHLNNYFVLQILKRKMPLELSRIITSLQIRAQNTFIFTHTHLRLLGGLCAMNGLENRNIP